MTEYTRPTFSSLQARIEADLASMPGVLRTPLSVALARSHHSTNGYVQWADKQSSPLTCEEERLYDWAALYKVDRLLARAATGATVATGTVGSPILKDIQARGPNGLDYAVSTATEIGVAETNVLIRCLTTGSAGNLTAGQKLTFIDPVPGVSSTLTVSAAGIQGGEEQEKVDDWRVRVADEWQTIVSQGARGGKPVDYRYWARSAHPSVTTALVQEHAIGLGTIIIRPICNGLPDRMPTEAVLEAVEAYLETVAVATADWRVAAPIKRAVAVTIDLLPVADTSENRAAINSAVGAAVLAETSESAVLQMAELDAAIATVTTQYTRIAPVADIAVVSGEVLVLDPITWA